MRKTIIVKLVSNAKEEFKRLNKVVSEERQKGVSNSESQQLLKSIKQKIELIKINPQYGNSVSKRLIKASGISVDNLFVLDLSGYWRMIYTLMTDEIKIMILVLDIIDHEKYNKLFGYRKK